jgi:phosphoribosylanthranilate isomerase
MSVQIKICGITRLDDARYCAGGGADFLGFVFVSESPRAVTPDNARDICEWVFGCRKVGVFVDAPTDQINQVVDHVGLDLVQLHGDETPWECTQISVPVIKAIRVKPEDTADSLEDAMSAFKPHVEHFLLDTFVQGQAGGTGVRFNWEVAAQLSNRFSFLLAGGITADNFVDAVQTVQPYGVDLSSGVEETPGVKSIDLLNRLFEARHSLYSTEADT